MEGATLRQKNKWKLKFSWFANDISQEKRTKITKPIKISLLVLWSYLIIFTISMSSVALFLWNRIPQEQKYKIDLNLLKTKTYQQSFLKNYFNNFFLKKSEDNFAEYQKKYFMNSYWIFKDTLKSSDKLNSNVKEFVADSTINNNSIKENEQKFDNFFAQNKFKTFTLTNVNKFNKLDSNVLKPVLEKYINKFFENQSIENILSKYNLYLAVEKLNLSFFNLYSSNMGQWYLDFEKSKKLYFVNSNSNNLIPRIENNKGAQISVIAIKKEEQITLFQETDIEKVMKDLGKI